MGRSPCCSKEGLNRGAWTAQEDRILREFIRIHGEGKWRNMPKRAGLKRCGKSCRLRWLNYLRPDIKRGNISPDEEELIIRLHKLLGNRWSLIAGRLPGRTDNEIKNYWNTNLGRKVQDHQNTAPHLKLSSRSVEKTLKNTNIINLPHNTNSLSQPKMNNFQVIRTKATKCSKVILAPQPRNIEHFDTKKAEATVETEQYPSNKADFKGSSSFASTENNQTSELPTDFNIGELCFSDLLNCYFPDSRDLKYSNDSNKESSSSFKESMMFLDEMLQDWTNNNNCVQPNVASDDLHSLASMLDSRGEWQVE
ncbi:hypothetical protein I3843_03G198100 [Carya illinoinensis]|uniref:Myb-related protein 123 n=1 Tax=Carya illinoinensis TaxID=32201 RepID=A0A922FIR7_CARIL|nr:hypothetical protein I3760_03G200700 [Carya illinoinensis]KAG6723208.1 hypothetical protein I3842_03G198000 [Carya illinoinensis]KAG7988642.1 hypothetical protein I3843_03G198100 [Carya illinoinensis]